ncbi:MAG: inositol monophosphatase family protein [bacterium]|nr:inositol monophosphatase family protein [bacterium]
MTDLAPLIQAVRLAAILCREVQRHHIIHSEKTGQEPVTIADYGVQAILCRAIQQHFPGDAIIAEESGRQFAELVAPEQRRQIVQLVAGVLGQSVEEAQLIEWLDYGSVSSSVGLSRWWLIDPVDGTKGFLALRHYVIAAGLVENGEPTAAVVGAPAFTKLDERGAVFYTDGDAGYMIPMSHRPDEAPHRLRVSEQRDPMQMRALESVDKSHAAHERMAEVRDQVGMSRELVERIDSQEKYCRIAAGEAELYLRLPRQAGGRPHMAWDHGPGTALVRAAGGTVTDVDGSPMNFMQGAVLKNQGIIATNGIVHDQVVEATQRVLQT